jgi:hypothetical protein
MSAPDLLFTPSSSRFTKKRRWPPRGRIVLIILVVLALFVIGIGTWFVLARSTATGPVVGQLAFVSSGQPLVGGLGVADQVQVDLRITQAPAAGKSYYVWLLTDRTNEQAVLLGTIALRGGAAHMVYTDARHTNLLANNSRLLITEQASSPLPHLPSSGRSDWRYLAQISQTLPSGQHYSLLDHLRHLLASDPTLKQHGLSDGLAPWLYRNVDVVYAASTSAHASWHADTTDSIALRSHLLQVLAYLDGTSYVARDLPAGTAIPTQVYPAGNIGLLEFEPQQNPAPYLKHVALHVNGVASSPGASSSQRVLAAQITGAINHINTWLEKVRQDVRQLTAMTDQQLQQPAAGNLLNDMATNATLAYKGQGSQSGVQWVYLRIQRLATVDITPI